jgi:hypothetical protein
LKTLLSSSRYCKELLKRKLWLFAERARPIVTTARDDVKLKRAHFAHRIARVMGSARSAPRFIAITRVDMTRTLFSLR